MSKRTECGCCNQVPEKVAIALCKKLLGRNLRYYLCLKCLANYLDTTEEHLLDLAEEFKREGCTLFN
jgi:hypothetical protein